VGRVTLYLLDSNDLMNDPADRSIISKLYDDQPEFRLVQEMILGIGGWKLLEILGITPAVCHFNEGHAAFVVLERARSMMRKTGMDFQTALWATRAGNIFTTHTAVAAGFDSFSQDLIERYFKEFAVSLGISLEELLALGQKDLSDPVQPFNMAILAMRGSTAVNAVSLLHGKVSRQLFQPLFPGWPNYEVPVQHITNGVHMPSWDSQKADEVWMKNAGKACWSGDIDRLPSDIEQTIDEELWSLRMAARKELVGNVRQRMEFQFRQYGADHEVIKMAKMTLNAEALTIGFARRFASYKRPNLLLQNPQRLLKILQNSERPVQLVVAGKAHPQDEEGKRLIQEMVNFSRQPQIGHCMVFLPDYDIELAQEMVQGLDVWINTPRRPWEACGTSGMKVLVNGGLNLSVLDGWWAEAYRPDIGWCLGDGQEHDSDWDRIDAEQLYNLLENEIIPEYYDRNPKGIPVKWVNRIRMSMCELATQFNSNRMSSEYMDKMYRPAANRLGQRTDHNAKIAKDLALWQRAIDKSFGKIRFVRSSLTKIGDQWQVECEVFMDSLPPGSISVEVYADPVDDFERYLQTLTSSQKLSDFIWLFKGQIPGDRPPQHYSLRIVPSHPAAIIPLENNHILWKHPI